MAGMLQAGKAPVLSHPGHKVAHTEPKLGQAVQAGWGIVVITPEQQFPGLFR